jgi:tetratricopeptide (TPR) repeat protein
MAAMSTSPSVDEVRQRLQRHEHYLSMDPNNRRLLADVIDMHLLLGQAEQAQQTVTTALQAFPDDSYFRFRQSHVWIAQERWEDAAALLSTLEAVLIDPAVAHNLAYVWFRLGRYDRAKETLAPLVQDGTAAADSVVLYLRSLHHLREIREALRVAELHLPTLTDPQFLGTTALLYLDDGQLDAARRLSQQAAVAPQRPIESWIVDGTLALSDGELASARLSFEGALALQPHDGRSWYGLGIASLVQQDLPRAREQLQRAAGYLRQHIGSFHALAWCHLLSGDLAAAEQAFVQALAIDRNFGESHGGLAVVYAIQHKTALAEQAIRRANGLDPGGLSARFAQMILDGAVGDQVAFRQAAREAVSARVGNFAQNLMSHFLR